MVTKTSKSSIRKTYDKSTEFETSYQTDESWTVPSKVQGSWMTFADGSRFRRPTAYARSHVKLTRGSAMVAIGSTSGKAWERITESGGYRVGNFFSGNWVYMYADDFGLPNILAAPSIVTDERNEAVTKALNKLADQKANIGENLATLGQTIRMFKDPVTAYVGFLRKMRETKDFWPYLRKSYREIIRGGGAKPVADAYLQYVYGFAPLMQDIFNLSEMAKAAGKKPLLLNGTAQSTRDLSGGSYYYGNISGGQREYWKDGKAASRTRTTLWAKLSDEYRLSRTLNQLGLTNPASLVWELVPYSFLVDWVLPIGPVLSAVTAPAGLDFVGGSTSRRLTANWSYDIYYRWVSGYKVLTDTPATGQFRYDGYKREVHTAWPKPGLWFVEDPLGLSHDGSDRIFKALALAVTNLPRL